MTDEAQDQSTDLVVLTSLNPIAVFSTEGGLDPLLKKIEEQARSVVLDPSTEKGRDEIRSVAYKIKRSRTTLFKMAKDLTEDWREQTKKVNAERARMEESLEKLEEEIRAPLTEFENKEKERVEQHEGAIGTIATADVFPVEPSVSDIEARIELVNGVMLREWQEFNIRAKLEYDKAITALTTRRDAKIKYEADQAELARHRAEQAAREQKEREEKLQAEAAEKARLEAEAKAAAEKAEIERKAKEDADRAEAERLRIEAEKKAAEDRAAKAEADRVAAEKKAADDAVALAAKVEADRVAAEIKAKADADAAVQREKDRQEEERKADADAAAKREADLEHKKKINNEALDDLKAATENSDEDGWAKDIVIAIASGKVRNIRITY